MGTVYFDCGGLQQPTAATVDQIARLKLTAKQSGCELELTNASSELVELISFLGLAPVLGVQSRRQAEKRKQPGCIEEEGELDDPSLG
jgi:hypothetical protein